MHAELHTQSLSAPDANPSHWVALLHGIMGAGKNLRTLGQGIVAARPDFGVVLVDLPNHGESPDTTEPPTLAICAREVARTIAALPGPCSAVVGHSYGGKVALNLLDEPPPSLRTVITLDSSPGPRKRHELKNDLFTVIEALEAVPFPLERREALVEALTQQEVEVSTARWLTSNLLPGPSGFTLRIEPNVIRAMLADYFGSDLWHLVAEPPGNVAVHLIIAGGSISYSETERSRAADLAAAGGRTHAEVIPKVKHWLHVENPQATLDAVLSALA